uniref:Uncharacterized protein n=1 Tax=Aegilops tauschii subsp. strangulata TaxID=200361 RepID=A0A453SHX9_AEGTS
MIDHVRVAPDGFRFFLLDWPVADRPVLVGLALLFNSSANLLLLLVLLSISR